MMVALPCQSAHRFPTWFLVGAIFLLASEHFQLTECLTWTYPNRNLVKATVGTNASLTWTFFIAKDENVNSFTFYFGGTLPFAWAGSKRIVSPQSKRPLITIGNDTAVLSVHGVTRADRKSDYCLEIDTGSPSKWCIRLEVLVPPSVKISPTEKTANETGRVDLFCNATGHPAPNLTWTVVETGNEFSRREHLIIDPLSREHSGTYACTASNEAGNATAKVHLDVQYKPTGTTILSNAAMDTVTANDRVTLNCSTDAHPPADLFRIYHQGKLIARNAVFTKQTATWSDRGQYTCVPSNRLGRGQNASVILDVLVPPKLDVQPRDQTINETDTLLAYCNASGNPTPNITWTRIGRVESIVETGKRMNISNVTKNDAGVYECRANNGVEKSVNARFRVTVNFPPKLDVQPRDQTVNETGTLLAYCNASGNRTPNITWTKVGQRVSVIETGKRMNISNVTKNDAGVYECRANNGVGKSANARFRVTVNYPPKLVVSPEDRTVNESETLVAYCNASGNPEPNITWVKIGVIGPIATGNQMSITNANPQNNAGIYECRANNGIGGIARRRFKVTVNYRPIIAAWSKSIDSWIGHLTTIPCLVGGIPTPVVSWSRPGKKELVTINQTHVISRLTVVPKKPSDFGAYTCEAANILGRQAQSTDLKQLRPPDKPVINVGRTTANTITVRWKSPDDGGRPITSYRIQIRPEDGNTWQDCPDIEQKGAEMSCSFTDLDSGTKYVVRVIVVNEIGTSEPDVEQVKTEAGSPKSKGSKTDFPYYWIIVIIAITVVIAIIICLWRRYFGAEKDSYPVTDVPMYENPAATKDE